MDPLGWDITKAASSYSTLAGVLAGFVLTLIGLVLYNRDRRGAADESGAKFPQTLSWMLSTFISLLMTSFLFAVISGEVRTTVISTASGPQTVLALRPLTSAILVNCLFAVSGMQLMLSIIWFASQHVTDKFVWANGFIAFFGLGLIILVYVNSSFTDLAHAATSRNPDTGWSYWQPGVLAFGSALVGGILLLLASWLFRRRKKRPLDSVLDFLGRVSPVLSLVVTFAVSGVAGYVEDAPEVDIRTWHVTDYRVWLLSGVAVLVFLFVLSLPRKTVSGDGTSSSKDKSSRQEVAPEDSAKQQADALTRSVIS